MSKIDMDWEREQYAASTEHVILDLNDSLAKEVGKDCT